jgi:hypothetical protein
MNHGVKWIVPALLLGSSLAMLPNHTFAQNRHPAYVRALADLRSARAHLQGLDRGEMQKAEQEAVTQIDQAMDEIRRASVDDGKGPNDHAPIDTKMDPGTRLHHAMELLDRAGRDIAETEDNQSAKDLQQRAYEHIRKAKEDVQQAIRVQSHS